MSVPNYRDHIAVECFKSAFNDARQDDISIPAGTDPLEQLKTHWGSVAFSAILAANAFQSVLQGSYDADAQTTVPEKPAADQWYVSMTWHNFPEGGTFATVVSARDDKQAKYLALHEMASSYRNNYGTPAGVLLSADEGVSDEEITSAVAMHFLDEWHVVDCFNVAEFFAQHAPGVKT